MVIPEGRLRFEFPETWEVTKFDEWDFYRTRFLRNLCATCDECAGSLLCKKCQRQKAEGTSGIDILAISDKKITWLIEIKDYVLRPIASLEFLADAVAKKVKDTLACLVIARSSASVNAERTLAKSAIACSEFRVVLHLEQPPTKSNIHPSITREANVLARLRELVKSIDRQALVTSIGSMKELPWKVTAV